MWDGCGGRCASSHLKRENFMALIANLYLRVYKMAVQCLFVVAGIELMVFTKRKYQLFFAINMSLKTFPKLSLVKTDFLRLF